MKKYTAIMMLTLAGFIAQGDEPESQQHWYEKERITGDLMGLRPSMEEAGITPFAYYNAIVAANVSGGVESGQDYGSDMYFGMKFDLDKLLGWKDTVFTVSGIDRHGNTIAPEVGSYYDPMQLVGGQTTFLYQMHIEKTFNDNLAVKVGRMGSQDDFGVSPLYGYSINNVLNGTIRANLMDGVMTVYPYATWGARVKYTKSDNQVFQIGAYQLSEDMWDSEDQGVDLGIDRDDGVSIMTQYDWYTEINGRPARFYLGMNNAFFSMDELGATDTSHHFIRLYGHGDVEVIDDLTLFGLLSYTPNDEVALMQSQVSVGANWKGLFPGRPDDHTIFYVTYGQLSDELPASASGNEPEYEAVYEIGHRFQVTPAIYAQPCVQYIQNPGGTGDDSDAVVVGMQAGMTIF